MIINILFISAIVLAIIEILILKNKNKRYETILTEIVNEIMNMNKEDIEE